MEYPIAPLLYIFCMKVSLVEIELQLKKRLQHPYKWYRKQNNTWDFYTNFIYSTLNWEDLIPKIIKTGVNNQLDKNEIFYYTINRWYNFWSALAIENLFTEIKGIEAISNSKSITTDFIFNGIEFDHKTSVFPKKFKKTLTEAQENERELIIWLYKNQSTQKRFHLENRLFVVVHQSDGEHWKLKAEISLLKEEIHNYVSNFSPSQLHSFNFTFKIKTLSDIIWVTR